MIEKIKENLDLVAQFQTDSKEEIEAFRIKYLGKKGMLNDFFAAFKEVPGNEKKEFGQALNTLKNAVTEKVITTTIKIDFPEIKGKYWRSFTISFPSRIGFKASFIIG